MNNGPRMVELPRTVDEPPYYVWHEGGTVVEGIFTINVRRAIDFYSRNHLPLNALSHRQYRVFVRYQGVTQEYSVHPGYHEPEEIEINLILSGESQQAGQGTG